MLDPSGLTHGRWSSWPGSQLVLPLHPPLCPILPALWHSPPEGGSSFCKCKSSRTGTGRAQASAARAGLCQHFENFRMTGLNSFILGPASSFLLSGRSWWQAPFTARSQHTSSFSLRIRSLFLWGHSAPVGGGWWESDPGLPPSLPLTSTPDSVFSARGATTQGRGRREGIELESALYRVTAVETTVCVFLSTSAILSVPHYPHSRYTPGM